MDGCLLSMFFVLPSTPAPVPPSEKKAGAAVNSSDDDDGRHQHHHHHSSSSRYEPLLPPPPPPPKQQVVKMLPSLLGESTGGKKPSAGTAANCGGQALLNQPLNQGYRLLSIPNPIVLAGGAVKKKMEGYMKVSCFLNF
jgi:hypothetical protein